MELLPNRGNAYSTFVADPRNAHSDSPPGSALPAADPVASPDTVRIGPAQQRAAIERLLGGQTPGSRQQVARFLRFAEAHQVDLQHLWSRVDERGRIRFSTLIVPNAGRAGLVFFTHPEQEANVTPLAHLIRHAIDHVPRPQIHLFQALLEPEELLERRVLEEAGFTYLADLNYMERALGVEHPTHPPSWPAGVHVHPYHPQQRTELCGILQGSYEQTLDCAGLNGLRDVSDILRGHESAGVFEPDLWRILRVDDAPAGAVLLNPSSDQRSVELVYIGLTRAARGRGLGRMLLQHGLHTLRHRRERSVTLAVDQANKPALSIYQSEGFRVYGQRVAMIRSHRM
jgi:mycothiol synthase